MSSHEDIRGTRDRFQALSGDPEVDRPGTRTRTTNDPAEIVRWAAAHQAEPATGEATPSGPAGRVVKDGGAGIRFNFPGWAPYRKISWEEWLEHFQQHDLLLVYADEDEHAIRQRAQELWAERGNAAGTDKEDWFAAKREFDTATTGGPVLRYRLVKRTSTPR